MGRVLIPLFFPRRSLDKGSGGCVGAAIEIRCELGTPAAQGTVFADMDANHWEIAWAEQTYSEGLVYGCGSKDGKPVFCPDEPMVVTRELIAYFIATNLK